MLIDAGADTASTVRLTDVEGTETSNDTPLAYTNLVILEKKVGGKDATVDQLHSLEAISVAC